MYAGMHERQCLAQFFIRHAGIANKIKHITRALTPMYIISAGLVFKPPRRPLALQILGALRTRTFPYEMVQRMIVTLRRDDVQVMRRYTQHTPYIVRLCRRSLPCSLRIVVLMRDRACSYTLWTCNPSVGLSCRTVSIAVFAKRLVRHSRFAGCVISYLCRPCWAMHLARLNRYMYACLHRQIDRVEPVCQSCDSMCAPVYSRVPYVELY